MRYKKRKRLKSKKQSKTYIDDAGYFRFVDSDILFHRWVAEKMLGRKLHPWEVVHHINGNKLDNRPENLRVMTRSRHSSHHSWDRSLGDGPIAGVIRGISRFFQPNLDDPF